MHDSRLAPNDFTQKVPGFINRIVLCELLWVLESAYGYLKETIVRVLDKLLRTSQLKIEDAQSAWVSFRMYQREGLTFWMPAGFNQSIRRL